MKTSLVCTVLNEEKTIGIFIDSVLAQSVLPNEVLIVDGGSNDKTVEIIKEKAEKFKKRLKIKLIQKKGNRSIGRNLGIKESSYPIILITDSGCVLDKDWVKNISKHFKKEAVNVVSGYYKGLAKNDFQKALVPYVLVMEDKIKDEFLPSTRSMAIRKRVWEKLNGFNEKLSHNEDFEFANKIKNRYNIVFEKEAIVYWIPRKNLKQAFTMFFRFAFGDAEAGIYRDKVIYIFLRYIFAFYLICLNFVMKSMLLLSVTILLVITYFVWTIKKNYKYVKKSSAILRLPIIQFVSDISVMSGTIFGLLKSFSLQKFITLIFKNKLVVFILILYVLLLISVISWGVPNQTHPFTYHMDEWHFSQSLRTFLKYGSGSISGAASIPFFHIVSTIVFLIPFYLLKIIDPFTIKSAFDNLYMQQVFFEILRLHTLLYGVLTVSVLYLIIKRFISFFPSIFVSIFVFSPIWIFLSNYYKYDVTLVFWIVTTIYFLFKYHNEQKFKHYLFAGISCSLALSTKFTALPLFISYIFSYFLFSNKKSLIEIVVSITLTVSIFLFVGIPDMILGKGNYYELIYSTLIYGRNVFNNYNLNFPPYLFLLLKEFPQSFGYPIFILGFTSLIFFFLHLIRRKLLKRELFIVISTVLFLFSLLSFGIEGGGNRSLVLLPFFIILTAFFLKKLKLNRIHLIFLFMLIILVQVIQTLSWLSVKWSQDPRAKSSIWINSNITKGSLIGLENIPIYQMIPDVLLKEFYSEGTENYFKYEVIYPDTKKIPKVVLITNDYDDVNYLVNSTKKDMVKRLKSEGYTKVYSVSPDLSFYKLFSSDLTFILTYPTPRTISVYIMK